MENWAEKYKSSVQSQSSKTAWPSIFREAGLVRQPYSDAARDGADEPWAPFRSIMPCSGSKEPATQPHSTAVTSCDSFDFACARRAASSRRRNQPLLTASSPWAPCSLVPCRETRVRAAPKIAGRLPALGQMSPAPALSWGTRFAPAFWRSPSRCASVEGGKGERYKCRSVL